MREAIFEDLNPAPLDRRFRLAGYLLGAAVNRLRGRYNMFDQPVTPEKLADAIEEIARKEGIIVLDEWHHAPACRANNWCQRQMPSGPCTCGAAKARYK